MSANVSLVVLTDPQKEMVKEYQCLGCTCGLDPDTCDAYKPAYLGMENGNPTFRCSGHSAGTFVMGIGAINLGLPKGFNRVKKLDSVRNFMSESYTNIRLHENIDSTYFDKFNIPVWAMEKDGVLYVRTVSPRVDIMYVDVIKGGKLSDLPPGVVDVSKFYDSID